MRARLDRRAVAVAAALATVYVVWGSTYLAIALALESLPPLLMAGARFLVAGAVLYVVARRFDRGAARPDRRQWLAAAVTGAFLLGVGNGGVVWAQQTVPSGVAALVIASIPLWIALLGRAFFRERLSLATAIGIAVGFAGVALLVNPGGGSEVGTAGGLVLVLAAIGWSIGTLLSRGTRLTVPPLVGAGMQMLCGGVLLVAGGVAAGELPAVRLEETSLRSAGALAYLVVFGSIVAFSAYVWLLRNAATPLVATYAYVNPVVAVLLGWAVLGEAISARTLVAGGVVLAAVALIVSARPAPRRRGEPTGRAPSRTADRSRAAAALRGR
ncbi:MAG TPA: EamA family transporter [Gaiellaceae bacterium]|nr:EamA family transporter [Gaiellaceae bacterium]